MTVKTIEPEIQDKILVILPNDGPLSLKLMAQLTANMIISINDANVTDFIADLHYNLAQYEGT